MELLNLKEEIQKLSLAITDSKKYYCNTTPDFCCLKEKLDGIRLSLIMKLYNLKFHDNAFSGNFENQWLPLGKEAEEYFKSLYSDLTADFYVEKKEILDDFHEKLKETFRAFEIECDNELYNGFLPIADMAIKDHSLNDYYSAKIGEKLSYFITSYNAIEDAFNVSKQSFDSVEKIVNHFKAWIISEISKEFDSILSQNNFLFSGSENYDEEQLESNSSDNLSMSDIRIAIYYLEEFLKQFDLQKI